MGPGSPIILYFALLLTRLCGDASVPVEAIAFENGTAVAMFEISAEGDDRVILRTRAAVYRAEQSRLYTETWTVHGSTEDAPFAADLAPVLSRVGPAPPAGGAVLWAPFLHFAPLYAGGEAQPSVEDDEADAMISSDSVPGASAAETGTSHNVGRERWRFRSFGGLLIVEAPARGLVVVARTAQSE